MKQLILTLTLIFSSLSLQAMNAELLNNTLLARTSFSLGDFKRLEREEYTDRSTLDGSGSPVTERGVQYTAYANNGCLLCCKAQCGESTTYNVVFLKLENSRVLGYITMKNEDFDLKEYLDLMDEVFALRTRAIKTKSDKITPTRMSERQRTKWLMQLHADHKHAQAEVERLGFRGKLLISSQKIGMPPRQTS